MTRRYLRYCIKRILAFYEKIFLNTYIFDMRHGAVGSSNN